MQQYLGDGGAPAPKKRWISPVEEAFQPMTTFGVPPLTTGDDKPPPTPLSNYQDKIIAKLVGVLSDLKDSKAPPDSKSVQEAFGEAFRGTTELLSSTQSGFTRPLLSPPAARKNPIRLGFAGVLGDVAGAAGAKWELDVWNKWHAKLEGKYPFADSSTDATIGDYNEFFNPEKGLLWVFYEKALKSSLERSGDTVVPVTPASSTPSATRPISCSATTAAPSSRGPRSRPGPEKPVVEFDINLHSVSEAVSEVTLQIDGASKSYKNTPRWLHSGPPRAQGHGAAVRVRGFSALDEEIVRGGDFGLFRLLDAANSVEPGTEGGRPDGQPTLVLTWNLRSQKGWIRMDLRPSGASSALAAYVGPKHERIFRNYKCPRLVSFGVN